MESGVLDLVRPLIHTAIDIRWIYCVVIECNGKVRRDSGEQIKTYFLMINTIMIVIA